MGLRIRTNVASLNAQRRLGMSTLTSRQYSARIPKNDAGRTVPDIAP